MAPRRIASAGLAAAILLGTLLAHVRLIHHGNGNALFWQNPAQIGIAISSAGSDDVADASHQTAIQLSIASWNASTSTSARLVEDTSPETRARTNWGADDLHLVWFDEQGSSGYFPNGSATVALTPVWFSSSGRITDADVLFNGRGFQFSTSGQSGAFDIQDVATHELGHLLGLDHSGVVGASLYPYVSPGSSLHRSISSDDEHGLRDAYPSGPSGTIHGVVRRAADHSAVGGALVVARAGNGRTVASALATKTGAFQLRGLAPDHYTIYATPLDFPVSAVNLIPGHVVQTTFRSTLRPGSLAVAAGASVDAGDLSVDPDSTLSLGRNWDPLPLGAPRGRTTIQSLHGVALLPGSSLSAGDFTIDVSALAWMGNQVVFSVEVPAGAAPGHVDLMVTSSLGHRSILPGALEIVPLSPAVVSVTPSTASDAGGTPLTLEGRNFRNGVRVVIGERIYEDGVGDCHVVDGNTLHLTCAPTPGGIYDVVVIDPTGVEGRLADGFVFSTVPGIANVFPLAGATLGGTCVNLAGDGFVPGASVRIDGIEQRAVEVLAADRIAFTTAPGTAGGPYVIEVENPGGAVATAAFHYVAQPDPQLSALSPAVAPTSGDVAVTLHGDGFTSTSEVVFGADPTTGFGGQLAGSVSWLDAQTLQVSVPAHSSGVVSVLVRDSASGQATVLEQGLTYRSEGGGGGGCAASVGPGSSGWRRILEGTWWIAFAALAALWIARSRPSSPRRRLRGAHSFARASA